MVERGFTEPVFDAQRIFRVVLAAIAEPGRVLPIDPGCAPPGSIDPAAAATVLALCDADTPLWLSPAMAVAGDFFRFHTGAPIAATAGDALFVLATAAERPMLASLCTGTADFPDRSATLILAVHTIVSDDGWRLSGPGIADVRTVLPQPIDDRFADEWRQNHARFPLGIDVVLTARDRIAGLPRSTRLEN